MKRTVNFQHILVVVNSMYLFDQLTLGCDGLFLVKDFDIQVLQEISDV